MVKSGYGIISSTLNRFGCRRSDADTLRQDRDIRFTGHDVPIAQSPDHQPVCHYSGNLLPDDWITKSKTVSPFLFSTSWLYCPLPRCSVSPACTACSSSEKVSHSGIKFVVQESTSRNQGVYHEVSHKRCPSWHAAIISSLDIPVLVQRCKTGPACMEWFLRNCVPVSQLLER